MSGLIGSLEKRASALSYVLLTVTALAVVVCLVQPRPDAVPQVAVPVMLAE